MSWLIVVAIVLFFGVSQSLSECQEAFWSFGKHRLSIVFVMPGNITGHWNFMICGRDCESDVS